MIGRARRPPPARVALVAGGVVSVALFVGAKAADSPPMGIAAAFGVAYFAFFTLCILSLRLRAFVDAVTCLPPDPRQVALTFDDGPDPEWTPRVLDALDAFGAKGTFFVIGRKAVRHPEIVRAILARGHEVGVHGYTHDRLFSLRFPGTVRRDLEKAVETLTKITGRRPLLFRPPIGHSNPFIARSARALGLVTIGWNASGRDGVGGANPHKVAARVCRALRPGSIVLLHDAAERDTHRPAAADALPSILDEAQKRGLSVVPVGPAMSAAQARASG